jgi:uncharacterized membrane protein
MSEIITGQDIRAIAIIFTVVMFAAWGIGEWLGRRLRDKGVTQPSKFADASMALLGLLIAFTFGMSIERHDRRRLATVADSNAIGDFNTCAAMLKEPTRTKLQAVIQRYAQLRLQMARGARGDADIESALEQSDEMHDEMTQLVREALNNGTPIAVSLTNTLNAVTSNQAARLSAYRDRLPLSIVVLLFAAAISSTMLIGREEGRMDTPDAAGTIFFILLVAVAIYVTLDLNRPERGLIRVSQEPMERLLNSMSK